VDIAERLRSLGLDRYIQAFQDAEITNEVLPELTEADLRELGLPLGPRKIVLKAIEAVAGPPTTVLLPEAAREEAGSKAAPIWVEAGRRQLTVMFVDLVGSTALSSRLDPVEMGDLIRNYQNTVAGESCGLRKVHPWPTSSPVLSRRWQRHGGRAPSHSSYGPRSVSPDSGVTRARCSKRANCSLRSTAVSPRALTRRT
jgi:hypothetical protein